MKPNEDRIPVALSNHASRQMRKLPPAVTPVITSCLDDLRAGRMRHRARRIVGVADRWRIRVGYYRIVFETDGPGRPILIIALGNKKPITYMS